jgi:hypothetical protein
MQHSTSAVRIRPHIASVAGSVAAKDNAMEHVVPSPVGKTKSGLARPAGQKMHMSDKEVEFIAIDKGCLVILVYWTGITSIAWPGYCQAMLR